MAVPVHDPAHGRIQRCQWCQGVVSSAPFVFRTSDARTYTVPTHCAYSPGKVSSGQPVSFSDVISIIIADDFFHRLSTVFAFTPFTRPGPFSEARQAAYRFKHPIPGPDQDPEGWTSLQQVDIEGSVFSSRKVHAMCRVFAFMSLLSLSLLITFLRSFLSRGQ